MDPDVQPNSNPNGPSSWFTNLLPIGRVSRSWIPGGRRSLDELTTDSGDGSWQPSRAWYREDIGGNDGRLRWPNGEELESEWYETAYGNLFRRVREFVGWWFGVGDFPSFESGDESYGTSEKRKGGFVWLEAGFSDEFMWFVEQVAMQDNNAGGWDALLARRAERECLVTGVLGKVLEMGVFDDLLFGADPAQKSMLQGQDECTIGHEGE